jgi:hypothetical protein
VVGVLRLDRQVLAHHGRMRGLGGGRFGGGHRVVGAGCRPVWFLGDVPGRSVARDRGVPAVKQMDPGVATGMACPWHSVIVDRPATLAAGGRRGVVCVYVPPGLTLDTD